MSFGNSSRSIAIVRSRSDGGNYPNDLPIRWVDGWDPRIGSDPTAVIPSPSSRSSRLLLDDGDGWTPATPRPSVLGGLLKRADRWERLAAPSRGGWECQEPRGTTVVTKRKRNSPGAVEARARSRGVLRWPKAVSKGCGEVAAIPGTQRRSRKARGDWMDGSVLGGVGFRVLRLGFCIGFRFLGFRSLSW